MKSLTGDPKNVIELWTRNGPCEIHLLSGDITQLPVEQKMDIIMVSAFPGDYAAMKGTVLGALKFGLGINVGEMSFDKELDLRHHFSCWLSKPITIPESPYKKLLCFERRKNEMSVSAQISDMFRVFTPVFNNQDHTVITPLLATGHQGSNRALICKTMVNAAAHWITAGLPLRCLKIVSYDEITDEMEHDFQNLKAKYLAKTDKLKRHIFSKKYDIYISFNPVDKSVVQHILMSLKKKKSDVKVCSELAVYDKEKVWQDQIFKLMVASRRIIAVLSTSFLESAMCLEQYNMAMCCNRLVGMEVLAPFYIESITTLPTYMGLVQWIDCRARKDGETSEGKIQQACSTVLKAIEAPEQPSTGELKANEGDKFKYDVFISYSHKNPEHAEALVKTFKTFDENVKVFYDRSSLTTGVNWQNMLYRSLGECRCVIALLSPAYLASTMCMEEYSLALARYLSKDKGMTFIPMCVETIDAVPPYLCKVPIVDACTDLGIVTTRTAEMVCRWLSNEATPEKLDKKEDMETIEKIFCERRTKNLKKQYWVYTKTKDRSFQRIHELKLEKKEDATVNTSKVDLALIYANDAMHMAGTFCSIIDTLYPGLHISVQTMGDHKRMKALDEATRIVIFLSQELLNTNAQMSELHLALCRQRQTTEPVLYLIKTTPLNGRPFFPRILPFDIACTDPVWEMFEQTYLVNKVLSRKTIIHRKSDRMQHSSNFVCSYGEFFATTKAAEDILEFIVKPSQESQSVPPILMNVIACDLELHEELTIDVPVGLPEMEEEKAKQERSKSGNLIAGKDLDEIEKEIQDEDNENAEKDKKDDRTNEQTDKSDQKGESKSLTPKMTVPEKPAKAETLMPVVEEGSEAASEAPVEKNTEESTHNGMPTKQKHTPAKKPTKQASLEPVQEEGNEATNGTSPDTNEKYHKNGHAKKQRSENSGGVSQSQKSSASCTVI